jgi:SAM-dependent methyltransferase
MVKDKWEQCKSLEREWWKRWRGRSDMSRVREEILERAGRIEKIVQKHRSAKENLRILQIGPGANGEVHFMAGERFAIDPLASFFKDSFPELMDPAVRFIDGMGEKLPYENSYFDVILIINVLDHCSDPDKVLKEIYRCLRGKGILVLEVNIYARIVSLFHTLFNFLDREHPHALTLGYIKKKLAGEYVFLEESSAYVPLPEYDILKKSFLLILRKLRLAPIAYKLVAEKK